MLGSDTSSEPGGFLRFIIGAMYLQYSCFENLCND